MNAKVTIFSICLFLSGILLANENNHYQVPSDDFPDLESVVNYINTHSPPDNDLIFNIEGNSTFTEPHLTLTGHGTEEAGIFIQWDGSGEKPVVNFSGSAGDEEAGFTLTGSRYITIDGLDIQNPDGMLEYGIFLTNADAETGAHYNTIQNTHITLNKNNPNQTNGIRVYTNHSQTDFNGTNSNNSFLNNHISNVLLGYVFNSNTGNVDLMDTGNFVGITDEGEHVIDDIVMCGVYLLNQNGATVDNVQFLSLNRFDDGTNTAPATISTTGALPSGPLTQPIVISNNIIMDQYSPSTTIFGMYLNQRNVHYEVFNNKLHNIQTDGVGTTYASGIFLFGTGTTADIYNNMVSGIAAPHSPNISVRGIYVRTFNSVNIFYNSVLIDYTATHADNISAALSIHNNNDPVDIRNNIWVNKTNFPPMGNGFATVLLKNTASLSNIQDSSDNNIYYAGTPSSQNLIFYGSTTAFDQTLADFKQRAETFDQNSFTEDVPYLAADDLHVNPFAETVVRGNAQPVVSPFPITEDIDGVLRDTENPDIGADELPFAFPDAALNPLPADGEQHVSLDLPQLQWEYIHTPYYVMPDGFRVYAGTSAELTPEDNMGWVDYEEGLMTFGFDIEQTDLVFEHETVYFWKVIPTVNEDEGYDAEEIVTWSFETEALTYDYPNTAENPAPENNATDVSIALQQLTWDYVQDDMYAPAHGFRVYFGTSEILEEEDYLGWIDHDDLTHSHSIDLQETPLDFKSTYFWMVVPALDQEAGPDAEEVTTWQFTTEQDPEVDVQEFSDLAFEVYPNPASKYININLPLAATMKIYSADGAELMSKPLSAGSHRIHLGTLPQGIYMISILTGNTRSSQWLLIRSNR